MIIDLQTTLSGTVAASGVKTGQPITATAISEHVLDRAGGLTSGFPTLEDEGLSGPELWLVIIALAAANGADAAKTLTITLESDTTANLATAPVVHLTAPVFTGAQILAGTTLLRTQLPSADYKKFVGLRYTVSAGFTSFPVNAFITPDVDRNKIYPTGFTIDA